tara:strand:- start:301 stop:507 length:207 start_codon:yes stop_codon:yes gene_type:complete
VAAVTEVSDIERSMTATRAAQATVVVAMGGGASIDTNTAIDDLASARRSLINHLEAAARFLSMKANAV